MTVARDAFVAQLVEQRTENPRVGSSILSLATNILNAGIAQLIERRLAKAEVAGLSPVSRSIFLSKNKYRRHSQVVRHESAKL